MKRDNHQGRIQDARTKTYVDLRHGNIPGS